jgi:hypothetical protein
MSLAASTSRPVWIFVTVETVAGGLLLVLALIAVARTVASIDVGHLPPWRGLAVFPLVGLAAQGLRALRPGAVARRWHGVIVRRIDERWADER